MRRCKLLRMLVYGSVPAAPCSPLLVSSSLPLKKPNMNVSVKQKVWDFFPKLPLDRLLKLMQCKDAQMQEK